MQSAKRAQLIGLGQARIHVRITAAAATATASTSSAAAAAATATSPSSAAPFPVAAPVAFSPLVLLAVLEVDEVGPLVLVADNLEIQAHMCAMY